MAYVPLQVQTQRDGAQRKVATIMCFELHNTEHNCL